MLDKTNDRLIVVVAALLAWSVAANLAATLVTAMEPQIAPLPAGFRLGSETLAIVVAGCVLLLVPCAVSLVRVALLSRDPARAG